MANSKLSQAPQLSTLQLNQLFSNAIPFNNEPVALTPQKDFASSWMFWCNRAKGYIYPSRRDAVGYSRKIWRVQRKSNCTSYASVFITRNADILPFSIRWIHNCVLRLNEPMSRTHLKVFYLFPCMWLFSWLERIKKSPRNSYLAIHMLSMKLSAKLGVREISASK